MKEAMSATLLALFAFAVLPAGRVNAQYYPTYNRSLTNPYQRAPISPYVNLAVGPGTLSQRYFGIVQPQQQDITAQNQLGLAVAANQQNILGIQATDQLLATGHPVRFGSYERYFQNLNATATGVATAAGAGNFGVNLGQGGTAGAAGAARAPTRGR